MKNIVKAAARRLAKANEGTDIESMPSQAPLVIPEGEPAVDQAQITTSKFDYKAWKKSTSAVGKNEALLLKMLKSKGIKWDKYGYLVKGGTELKPAEAKAILLEVFPGAKFKAGKNSLSYGFINGIVVCAYSPREGDVFTFESNNQPK